MKEGIFDWLMDTEKCSEEDAVEAFTALCVSHRELVGKRFVTAYQEGDTRIRRQRVEALNEISRKDYSSGRGVFTGILEDMNRKV